MPRYKNAQAFCSFDFEAAVDLEIRIVYQAVGIFEWATRNDCHAAVEEPRVGGRNNGDSLVRPPKQLTLIAEPLPRRQSP